MVETIFMGAIMAVEAMIAWLYCERLFDSKRRFWELLLAYILAYGILFLITLAGNTTINSVSFSLANCGLFIYGYRVKHKSALLHAAFLCFLVLAA